MDPNGGNAPVTPKLDNTQPAPSPADPNQQPTDIYSQADSSSQVQPVDSAASIPTSLPSQPSQPSMDDIQPAADPSADTTRFQPPATPEPLLDQPSMPMTTQTAITGGGGKKTVVMVIGLLVGLAAIGGAAYGGYTMGKSAGRQQAAAEFQTQQAQQQTEDTASTDTATQEEVKLDLTNTTQTNKVKDESITAKVGEQANASDGFAIEVTNIERNFTTDETGYKLDDGKELVKVNFVMGNFASDRAKDVKSADLYLIEGKDTKVIPESRLTKYDGAFETVTIQPGEQVSGSIVYAVTKDVTPLTFVREQIYQISNQNKKVTSKTSITLTD